MLNGGWLARERFHPVILFCASVLGTYAASVTGLVQATSACRVCVRDSEAKCDILCHNLVSRCSLGMVAVHFPMHSVFCKTTICRNQWDFVY